MVQLCLIKLTAKTPERKLGTRSFYQICNFLLNFCFEDYDPAQPVEKNISEQNQ